MAVTVACVLPLMQVDEFVTVAPRVDRHVVVTTVPRSNFG
jgi:hypothetical protein